MVLVLNIFSISITPFMCGAGVGVSVSVKKKRDTPVTVYLSN